MGVATQAKKIGETSTHTHTYNSQIMLKFEIIKEKKRKRRKESATLCVYQLSQRPNLSQIKIEKEKEKKGEKKDKTLEKGRVFCLEETRHRGRHSVQGGWPDKSRRRKRSEGTTQDYSTSLVIAKTEVDKAEGHIS